MEIDNELKGLKNDRKRYEIELSLYQQKYSQLLKNEMGKDMKDELETLKEVLERNTYGGR